ncbi:FlaD/FlaE family flagellar protein [Halobium salinum]|uniref:FlaD/FlaE family flagellar protein n=1 Tax=Halobium salinum TaxID=1364940 RepID=A0ABD5PHA2_9EURY|nr:FlaD/FlaE family flagellar protein [Halobium salinum]
MSFATPHHAAAWVAVTAGGALVNADPTSLATVGEVGPLSVVLLSSGLFGSAILDRLRGGDDEETVDDGDDDALMSDDGLGGEMGGEMDGLDDMDDWGGDDDPFGGMGGDEEGDTDELEHRLDELEGEVGSLSSTVGTVRSENEEIAGQVEEVTENVRKLLDIYEMVTRGINPFVDDVAAGGNVAGGPGGADGMDGSFGLFGGEEAEEESDDDELDEDIANADAEGFFDEELAEDEAEDEDALDGFYEEEDGDEADDAEPAADLGGMDDLEDSDEMTTDDTDGGGKSFAELKAEYDSGDAEWAGEGEPEPTEAAVDDDQTEPAPEPEAALDGPELAADDSATALDFGDRDDVGSDPDDTLGAGLDDDPVTDTETVSSPDAEGDRSEVDDAETADATAPDGTPHEGVDDDWTVSENADDSGFQFVEEPEPGRPYLRALPSAYAGDLVVMEWLEYLVSESSPTDAARAIRYYENVEWISEGVKEDLLDFLVGFGEIDEGEALVPGTAELSRSHHTRSLSYINRLDDADAESLIVDRWDRLSGDPDGL